MGNRKVMPVITVEYETGRVLMLGYMNKEAFAYTLKTHRAYYYSFDTDSVSKFGEKEEIHSVLCQLKPIADIMPCLCMFSREVMLATTTELTAPASITHFTSAAAVRNFRNAGSSAELKLTRTLIIPKRITRTNNILTRRANCHIIYEAAADRIRVQ